MVNVQDLPVYVSEVVNKLSYVGYAYQIMMLGEFSDRTITDCSSFAAAGGGCVPYSGNDIIAARGNGISS